MKKRILIILIILAIALIFTFTLKPVEEKQSNTIKIGKKLNIQSFDLSEVTKLITGKQYENSDLLFESFTMTVSDKKNILSMNFSVINRQTFGDKRITVHLHGMNNELIVKNESLDKDNDFSIKKYLSSIFKIGQTKNNYMIRNNGVREHNFTEEELTIFLSKLKDSFIDDINKNEKLHIELLSRGYYNINSEASIHLVNINTEEIIDIKEILNDSRFETIEENGSIKWYKVNNLKGISVYSNTDIFKYYFLDENL